MVKRCLIEVCPVCNKEAKVKTTWTLNKYGMKYQYKVFIHEKSSHYVNIEENKRINKKGEILDNITKLLTSDRFRLGIFSLSEIREELKKNGITYNDISIRNSLLTLARNDLISINKKGKNVLYINNIDNAKLNFTFLDFNFEMEETDGDKIIKGHTFKILLRNDRTLFLNFIPMDVTGDVPSEIEALHFTAKDVTTNKDLKVVTLVNEPKEKRFLLRFEDPIPPGESRLIKMSYLWQEITPTFTFGSATEINKLVIEVRSKNPINIQVNQISPDRTANIDISDKVVTNIMNGIYNSRIELLKFIPFSILFIKWSFFK